MMGLLPRHPRWRLVSPPTLEECGSRGLEHEFSSYLGPTFRVELSILHHYWCFGTWILFSISYMGKSSQLTFIFFKMVIAPPTSYGWFILPPSAIPRSSSRTQTTSASSRRCRKWPGRSDGFLDEMAHGRISLNLEPSKFEGISYDFIWFYMILSDFIWFHMFYQQNRDHSIIGLSPTNQTTINRTLGHLIHRIFPWMTHMKQISGGATSGGSKALV